MVTHLISHDLYPTSRTTRRLDHVGTFTARSYQLVLSDTLDEKRIGSARTGAWHVFVERVIAEPYSPISSLILLNHRLIGDPITVNSIALPWTNSGITKTVDIGVISVIDEESFEHVEVANEAEREAHRIAWKTALGSDRVKVMNVGVVCKAGIGDGAYRVDTVVGEGGWVVGVQIDFASDTQDEWGKKFAKDVAERRDAVPRA